MKRLFEERQPERRRPCGPDPSEPARLARALGHELRLKIVPRCAPSLSPRELAAQEPNVSTDTALYHFKLLWEAGLIDVVQCAPFRADVRYTAPPWALELCRTLEGASVEAGARRPLTRIRALRRVLLGGR